MAKPIALIEAAYFFVIAIADKFTRWLHVVRNDKKDTAESGIKLLKTLIKVQNKNVPKIRDASFIYCVTFISFFVIWSIFSASYVVS